MKDSHTCAQHEASAAGAFRVSVEAHKRLGILDRRVAGDLTFLSRLSHHV